MADPGVSQSSLASRYLLACVAAAVSETVTYPLDLLKTLLQLQNERGLSVSGAASSAPQQRMSTIARDLVRREGLGALFSGLSVAVLRQCFNAGVSVGLYPGMREALLAPGETKESAALWKRALAGAVTGCIGQAIAQPTDVIKVRVQADRRLRAAGQATRYSGVGDAFRKTLAGEGLAGFYTALGSSVWRAGIINSAGIASYDATQPWAVGWVRGQREALPPWVAVHFPAVFSAFVCGVVTTVVSCPLDVVKTRLMNCKPGTYKGPNDCFLQLVKSEGLISLWKGIVPTYQRQALWNGIFWVAYENVLRVSGKEGI